MNTSPLSWKTFGPAFARTWNAFFETPVDLRTIGFVRTLYAAVVLINLAFWYPDLTLWFGESGVLPAQTAWDLQRAWVPSVLRLLPATDTVLWVCYAVYAAQAILLLLGVAPRFNAVCLFVWLCSFQSRNPILWDGEDNVIRLAGLWLMFMPLHRVWRRDLLLRRIPSPIAGDALPNATAPAWGLRMLQLQMCLIFLDTFWSKIQGEPWQAGTALYYAMRLDDFARLWIVPEFLISTPWVVRVITYSVLVIEFSIPILVWFRETRRPALVIALAFHLGCFVMMHLFLFHPIMLCGWAAFLTGDDWNDLARGWRRLKALVVKSVITPPAAPSAADQAAAEEELVATKNPAAIDPDRPACSLPW